MSTRKLINPATALAAGLLLGLVGHTAAATEEVVVYGNDVAVRAIEAEARLQADRKEYLDALGRDIEAQREKDLESIRAPEIKLAIAEVPSRG
jgi:hypothetical protein